MCGIVGAVSSQDVTLRLVNGLKRLEYRGYDSAGIATLNAHGQLERRRRTGKIEALETSLAEQPLAGTAGIAHTRWATHGVPSEQNAHPFFSHNQFAIVHNGIIENHQSLRSELQTAGYVFASDTDSEVIAHLLHFYFQTSEDLLSAVQKTVSRLEGAFALGILSVDSPDLLVAVRHGSPLVIGKGQGENFLASDPLALFGMTREFIYLEDGDIALLSTQDVTLINGSNTQVCRPVHHLEASHAPPERGEHRHFMRQEIFSQAEAIESCLASPFPEALRQALPDFRHILLIACGTSYHAALVARYWIEAQTGIACSVEIASEYRYRQAVIPPATLAVFISQSGETADTLAALRLVREKGQTPSLAICNVAESSLCREAQWTFLTAAGPEIGVASTKAFTTQLVAFLRLVLAFRNQSESCLKPLGGLVKEALQLDPAITALAHEFSDSRHALFIGRDSLFPIALEGALKLKEISYIHAEGYPAGELKHGPLALVDRQMPVIALAPLDALFPKVCSGLQEISARQGRLFVLTDQPETLRKLDASAHIIPMPSSPPLLTPILYTIPLQLLAYHVAVLKGTDVDQPRNLAKSVTVE